MQRVDRAVRQQLVDDDGHQPQVDRSPDLLDRHRPGEPDHFRLPGQQPGQDDPTRRRHEQLTFADQDPDDRRGQERDRGRGLQRPILGEAPPVDQGNDGDERNHQNVAGGRRDLPRQRGGQGYDRERADADFLVRPLALQADHHADGQRDGDALHEEEKLGVDVDQGGRHAGASVDLQGQAACGGEQRHPGGHQQRQRGAQIRQADAGVVDGASPGRAHDPPHAVEGVHDADREPLAGRRPLRDQRRDRRPHQGMPGAGERRVQREGRQVVGGHDQEIPNCGDEQSCLDQPVLAPPVDETPDQPSEDRGLHEPDGDEHDPDRAGPARGAQVQPVLGEQRVRRFEPGQGERPHQGDDVEERSGTGGAPGRRAGPAPGAHPSSGAG